MSLLGQLELAYYRFHGMISEDKEAVKNHLN